MHEPKFGPSLMGGGKFGDNHKVKLGKKRSKTNGVKLSKMASNLWVFLGAMSDDWSFRKEEDE